MNTTLTSPPAPNPRRITQRTRGQGHGPITRLMSPSDLGQVIKPFVFLDLFEADQRTMAMLANMPLHPHSGIATVTVPLEGAFHYEDPAGGAVGTLGYGAVEWARAGGGMWHGKELSATDTPRIQGFQLWLALPAELENGEQESRYIEAQNMRQIGPAHVIIGNHEGVQSPVPAQKGINYLLVTLKPGERWTYRPPAHHSVGWLALAKGRLSTGVPVDAGEMVVFEPGKCPLHLKHPAMKMPYSFSAQPCLTRIRCTSAPIRYIPQHPRWKPVNAASPNWGADLKRPASDGRHQARSPSFDDVDGVVALCGNKSRIRQSHVPAYPAAH